MNYCSGIVLCLVFCELSSCSMMGVTNNGKNLDATPNETNSFAIKDINHLLSTYKNNLEFRTKGDLKNIKSSKVKNSVTISWENVENPMGKQVNGYKLYFGSAPEQYDGSCIEGISSPIIIPRELLKNANEPIVTIKNMSNKICYFAVASYNEWGESVKSTPIKKTLTHFKR